MKINRIVLGRYNSTISFEYGDYSQLVGLSIPLFFQSHCDLEWLYWIGLIKNIGTITHWISLQILLTFVFGLCKNSKFIKFFIPLAHDLFSHNLKSMYELISYHLYLYACQQILLIKSKHSIFLRLIKWKPVSWVNDLSSGYHSNWLLFIANIILHER